MGKLIKLLVAAAILYFAVGFGYEVTVASKLKHAISPTRGDDVEVKDVRLNDWYLQGEIRVGTAVLSTKSTRSTPDPVRGLVTTRIPFTFQCTGRFWPMQVQHSPLPKR